MSEGPSNGWFDERGKLCRARAGCGHAGAVPVSQANLVESISIMDNLLHGLEVDDSLTRYSEEWGISEPFAQRGQPVVRRVLMMRRVNPGASILVDRG